MRIRASPTAEIRRVLSTAAEVSSQTNGRATTPGSFPQVALLRSRPGFRPSKRSPYRKCAHAPRSTHRLAALSASRRCDPRSVCPSLFRISRPIPHGNLSTATKAAEESPRGTRRASVCLFCGSGNEPVCRDEVEFSSGRRAQEGSERDSLRASKVVSFGVQHGFRAAQAVAAGSVPLPRPSGPRESAVFSSPGRPLLEAIASPKRTSTSSFTSFTPDTPALLTHRFPPSNPIPKSPSSLTHRARSQRLLERVSPKHPTRFQRTDPHTFRACSAL